MASKTDSGDNLGGAIFFCFQKNTHPWNFGTCFGDFEFKNDENPDYLCCLFNPTLQVPLFDEGNPLMNSGNEQNPFIQAMNPIYPFS